MRRSIPIPEDFSYFALTCDNAKLTRMYDISECTVRKWRKILDIPAPAPIKPPEKTYKGMDNAEQIKLCLNCKLKSCAGNCLAMRQAKKAAGQWNHF